MKFNINPAYLVYVNRSTDYSALRNKTDLTGEELFKLLKGEDIVQCLSTEDHPEFTKLRLQLEELGYTEMQRIWWNGDRVVEPFILNDVKFNKDDTFPSAGAMRYRLI